MKKVLMIIGVTLLVAFMGGSLGWTQSTEADFEADFIVYFDKHGNVKGVELTERGKETGCKIEAQGEQLTLEKINEIISRHRNIEKKSHSVINLSGSPDCIIYLNNYPICICCQ